MKLQQTQEDFASKLNTTMASSAVAAAKEAPNWKNRDDHRKQKELEEARKAGTALPETDEDGKAINPHIPQYIAQAPCMYLVLKSALNNISLGYLNNNQPSLKHQRQHKKEDFDKVWYTRGQKSGPAATKFRKGACTNCGAMTHNAKVSLAKSCMHAYCRIGLC